MKSVSFRLTLPFFLATTMLAPVGSAFAAAHVAVHKGASSLVKKYAGPSVAMRWGPVKVTIKVKNRKIVKILSTAPVDRPRSLFINGQALPLLTKEVLQAQSAAVSIVSGATMTSNAYIKSLQGALKKAHL